MEKCGYGDMWICGEMKIKKIGVFRNYFIFQKSKLF
jgi:hypothetical protein